MNIEHIALLIGEKIMPSNPKAGFLLLLILSVIFIVVFKLRELKNE